MNDKKVLLPIVIEEVVLAFKKEFEEGPSQLHLDQELWLDLYVNEIDKRLNRENPYICNFIRRAASESKAPLDVARTAFLLYRLLEKQAEYDRRHQNF